MSRTTFDEFEKMADATVEHLADELKKIRSGRATPSLIEDVQVEAYGSVQPLKNLASINVSDPTLLTVQPWDRSLFEIIGKSIVGANLGLNPIVSADFIRVPMPSLTEERRKEYVKVMKEHLEEARISIRNLRKDVLLGLDQQKNAGEITEDDYFRFEKDLQKMVESTNLKIENIGIEKEKELLTI